MLIQKRIVFLANALLIFLFSCNQYEAKEKVAKFCIPDSLLRNVTLDTVKTENAVSGLSLSGKITFNEDNVVKVYPLVSGNVADVKVSLGDYVKEGQLLAVVRSSEMANYYNEYNASQSELAIAKKKLEVTKDMRESGLSSEKDLITAQNEYDKTLSQFIRMKEVLKIYGSSHLSNDSTGSGYLIKSPISGFIVDKNVNAGMELRPDDTENMFTITDLKEVWAVANVFETDIAKIKVGEDAQITALSYPDRNFKGQVERVGNILNPETNVMNIKVGLRNDDYALKPGMIARISLVFNDGKEMQVIPTKTIIFDDNKNFVVRFRNKCDVSLVQVQVVKSFDGKSYIEDGVLNKGDLIIAQNALFIFTALRKL